MAPSPPYATVDDVAARLGRPVADTETERVETLLLDASVYVDLNLSTCVATIDTNYPGLLTAVVAGAVARAVETPIGDVSQVRIGDAAMTYMAPGLSGGGAKPSTGGLLSSDDIATLRKACGSSSVMPGVRSVPLTSTKGGGDTVGVMSLADYYRITTNDTVINLPEPEEDDL